MFNNMFCFHQYNFDPIVYNPNHSNKNNLAKSFENINCLNAIPVPLTVKG
jgi:hypothetical protein